MTIRRIALLCSGLQPGGDGVGDYCRRLSRELQRLGVECPILALNDRSIAPGETTEEVDDTSPLVRLSDRISTGARLERAGAALSGWQPDWISLQFVSFGFDRRGLVYKELSWLPRLLRGRNLHLMLHELWTGMGPEAPRKDVWIGLLQRQLILALLRRLRPKVLHTTTPFFRRALACRGAAAEVLPLFGNIPVTSELAGPWLYDAVRAQGGPDLSRERRSCWLVGLFGGILAHWPADPILARLEAIAKRANRSLLVISAGNAGPGAAALLQQWRERFPGIRFVAIGPRSEAEISQFLNSMDFGLTSYPYFALGKSGSAAAMLEHGLPLIVSWGDIASEPHPISSDLEPLVWHDDARLEARLTGPQTRVRHPERSGAIARELLARLSGVPN